MSTKLSILISVLVLSLSAACGSDNPAGPSSDDRAKFVGNWAGAYQCTNLPGDTLVISLGDGDLEFGIKLHWYSSAANPEVTKGELTDVDVITIPNQTIGGFDGSGEIKLSNGTLSLSQSGFGLTCKGTYTKF